MIQHSIYKKLQGEDSFPPCSLAPKYTSPEVAVSNTFLENISLVVDSSSVVGYSRTHLFTQEFPIFVCHQAIFWKHIIILFNHCKQNKRKLRMQWMATCVSMSLLTRITNKTAELQYGLWMHTSSSQMEEWEKTPLSLFIFFKTLHDVFKIWSLDWRWETRWWAISCLCLQPVCL